MGEMSCKMDGACQDQAGMGDDGCCDVSYEPSLVTEASGASQSQQVLLLNAAQPPPILVSFNFPEIPVKHIVHFEPDFSFPLPDEPVYLLTSRFRI